MKTPVLFEKVPAMLTRFITAAALTLVSSVLSARSFELGWDVSLYSAGATEKSLPFWMVTNRNGIFPNTHGTFMVGDVDFRYGTRRGMDIHAGVKLSGTFVPVSLSDVYAAPLMKDFAESPFGTAASGFSGMIEEVYAGFGWKMLRLDLGMIDRTSFFNGLSLTGGDVVWTGNARNAPGYSFQVDWFDIPGTRGIFSVKANYADYRLLDNRYVDGAMLHNKSLFFRFRLHERVHLQLGLEQWSLWGGDSPSHGRQPQSFKDYLRVVCGMSGGSDATASDQVNVLGDHRGRELIRIDWSADSFTMTFAHDIPFDDGSGMGLQNFPDGVNTVFFSFRDTERWVSDILYEFVYTKWQSGRVHDLPLTEEDLEKDPNAPPHIVGGCDNYFNNSAYRSGWTYYGRTAGLPLFTPMPANADGTVYGVCNNRVLAHHVGLGGKIARRIPYRLKATFSLNYGQYRQRLSVFEHRLSQISLAFEMDFPHILRNVPVSLSVGLYGDTGELYQDNFGLTIRLSYSGRRSYHP